MNQGEFFENPDFAEYVRLLGRLHRLVRDQQDESVEGEALRDEMDRPGEDLSEGEVRCVKAISTDLYSINGRRSEFTTPSPPPAALREVVEAVARQDALQALSILREHANKISPEALSYLRGQAFSSVGQYEIAADLFGHAKNLAPNNLSFGFMWLDALAHGNALEARSVAHEILGNRTDYPSLIVFKAADICFQEVNELPQAEQQQALVDLETVFSESVIGLEIAGVPASARSGAYALLGTCQNRLGEVGEARRSFDRALNLDPNFVAALVARGMLLYDANAELRSEAVSDFQRAIQLGSTLPWPYFFLAHDALSDDRFEEALQLASATLRMNASDHLRAYCLHWIAIAMASLGYPLALVRSVFENAIQLAPDEKQFQVNLELFDAAAQDSPRSHARWEKTPANRIQGFALREYQPVGVAT